MAQEALQGQEADSVVAQPFLTAKTERELVSHHLRQEPSFYSRLLVIAGDPLVEEVVLKNDLLRLSYETFVPNDPVQLVRAESLRPTVEHDLESVGLGDPNMLLQHIFLLSSLDHNSASQRDTNEVLPRLAS